MGFFFAIAFRRSPQRAHSTFLDFSERSPIWPPLYSISRFAPVLFHCLSHGCVFVLQQVLCTSLAGRYTLAQFWKKRRGPKSVATKRKVRIQEGEVCSKMSRII